MRRWFDGLQSLRALLFILIFISHSGGFLTSVPSNLGQIGVSGFLIIAGFLSSFQSIEKNIRAKDILGLQCKTVWRKIKKFYPLYFVFLFIAIPYRPCGVHSFYKYLLLIQSYYFDATVALRLNWPTWFLSSIMFSYFMAPVYNYILKKMQGRKSIKILLLIFLCVFEFVWAYVWREDSAAYGKGYYFTYIFPLSRTIDFIIGCLIAFIVQDCEKNAVRNNSCEFPEKGILGYDIVETIIIVLLLFLTICPPQINKIYLYTAFYLPFCAVLVYCFILKRGFITKFLGNSKVLQWIGGITFELFIVHRLTLLFYSQYSDSVFSWLYAIMTSILLAQLSVNIRDIVAIKIASLLNKKRKRI